MIHFPGTSYAVTTPATQNSGNTNTNKHSGIILTSARNSADKLVSNSSTASTRSSEDVKLDMEKSSTDDSGITMTPRTLVKTITKFDKDKTRALIEMQKRESAMSSTSSSSDATELTTEIELPKLKFSFEQLEVASTQLTKKITELKKKAEQIKTWEQYAKALATFADLATTVVLVGIAGTATGMTAIPLIVKFLALEKDLGNAFLTHVNSNLVKQDLPPARKGTDFLEALGRTIGEWGGLSENNAAYKAKYFAKCATGALDAGSTASTIYAPVLSGTLKNVNWYTSVGRVMINWFISTVIAKGDAKKEEAKHMEDVLKVVVAHQQIMLDIKNAEKEQNHVETVAKLDEAKRILGETQIVINQKTITIAELVDQLTDTEQNLAASQAQHKTSEELLSDANTKIQGLEKLAEEMAMRLAENREKLMEAQALTFSLRKEVTKANRFIYNFDPSPDTQLRQRRNSTFN